MSNNSGGYGGAGEQWPADLTDSERELIQLDAAIIQEILGGVGILIQYAINNLHRLVIDHNNRVIWPDAFNLLKLRAEQRAITRADGSRYVPGPTLEEYCDVVEHFAATGTLSFKNLDGAINALPTRLRVLIYAGIETAKQAMSTRPDIIKDLAQGRERTLLVMMYGAKETRQAHDLLVQRPNLCRFICDYVLMQLGVEPMPRSATRGQLPPPAGGGARNPQQQPQSSSKRMYFQ